MGWWCRQFGKVSDFHPVLLYGARIHKRYLTDSADFLRLRLQRGRRRGVSEIVATLLAIAITIIAGAAVFGFVNGQAATTERQYGSSVGVTVNYLQEQFSVVDMSYTSSSQVALYIYNYGRTAFSPVEVILYNATQSTYLTFNATKVIATSPTPCSVTTSTAYENPIVWNSKTNAGMQVSIGGISTLTLALPSCSGASFKNSHTYYVEVVGLYGNDVVYSQVKI